MSCDGCKLTLRQLAYMAEGARRETWEHTSHLLCLTYSVNRSKKDKALKPTDFNPYAPRRSRKPDIANISIRDLRGLFFPGSAPIPVGCKPIEPGKLVGGGKTPAVQMTK